MKKIILGLLVCALLLTTACATDFGLKSGSPKEDAESYLKKAMALTAKDFAVPGACETDITLDIHNVSAELADSIGDNMKLNLNVKADTEAKRFSAAASFTSDFITFSDYEVFFDPSLIALKAPDFFTAKPYLSINPETFVGDWNGSFFGELAPLPFDDEADFTEIFAEMLEEMDFDLDDMTSLIGDYESALAVYETQMLDLSNQFEDSVKYTYDGTYVTQTIQAGDTNDFISELFSNIMQDMMNSILEDAVSSAGLDMSEIFGADVGDMIRLKDDVILKYEFDEKGRVTAVSSNRFEIELNDVDDTTVLGFEINCKFSEKETSVNIAIDSEYLGLSIDIIYRGIGEVPAPAESDTKSFFDLSLTELMDMLSVFGLN